MKLSTDIRIPPWQSAPVETYCGHKADERPVSFTIQEHCYKVAEVIDQWYEGNVQAGTGTTNYFKVRTTAGELFLLRHYVWADTWSVKALSDPAAVVGVC